MTSFTPYAAALGGALIGTAAVLLWLLNGRIAGVSGVAAGLAFNTRAERAWRLLFLLGLVAGAGAVLVLSGHVPGRRTLLAPQWLVCAGLLVGYGTSLAGGCTSGHGVCGVARGSLRSLAATGVFLAVAMVTVFVARHLLGMAS